MPGRTVGDAIAAWEKVRPQGIKLPDPKTGELVDFLFFFRLSVIGKRYLNRALIPALCKKAGVPTSDVRGNITSHRTTYDFFDQCPHRMAWPKCSFYLPKEST